MLLEMMRMHVREHLADPYLRVAELARRHHVSVRRVYILFERIPTTPGDDTGRLATRSPTMTASARSTL